MQQTDEQSISIGLVEYPTSWLYKKNCKKYAGKLFHADFESL